MEQTFIRRVPRINLPSCLFIIYAVLRGYLKHPLWFMLTTFATMPKFRSYVRQKFPLEWAQAPSLLAWMYIRLKNKVGGQTAFEILRAAFLPVTLAVFGVTFKTVESPRTFDNMVRFHELSRKEIFAHTKQEVVEQSDRRYEYRCFSCGYADLFEYLKIPEVTPMFCSADNAFYNSYAPNKVTFSRGGAANTLAEGAAYCTFIYENHGDES